MSRSNVEKLSLFARYFSGLSHVYGTYDPATGKAWQVKAPITPGVMLAHLQGRQPYGVYLLTGETTRAIAVDFDQDDRQHPLEFCRRAADYGAAVYVERSKRRGHHVWAFAGPQTVCAEKARWLFKRILTEMSCPKTEVFPKQDRLAGPDDYGNFINAPLWGRLVAEGRTVFVDPENDFRPYADQWEMLSSVRLLSEEHLDRLIAQHQPALPEAPPALAPVPAPEARAPIAPTDTAVVRRTFGLPPCIQRMLREGVSEFQRVSCFRIAVALRKTGLPEDSAVVVLFAWAKKNRPAAGKQRIRAEEIREQVHWAYTRKYAGCGCDDPAVAPFCAEQCHLFKGRATPASTAVAATGAGCS